MEQAHLGQFEQAPDASKQTVTPSICAVDPADVDRTIADTDWIELAADAAEPNPFFEPWFLKPSLQHFASSSRTRLLRFGTGSELLGLVPIGRRLDYSGYPMPHLAGWLHHNAFLGVPLIRKGWERPFWRSLLGWADKNAGAGLFLHFRFLPFEGPCFEALRDVVDADRRAAAIVHRKERAMLCSDKAPDEYYAASMTNKHRKELRRQRNRLSELGELTFERRSDDIGLAEWIAAYLELERAGWKGTEGSALAQTESGASFFGSAITGAAAAGKLERLTLSLDGKPIAMLANFITPPGAYSFKTTYDERYARYSPGVLLQRENLALLEHEGVEWTDSCAAADHPMIDRLWHERRKLVRVSMAIGGPVRRAIARQILRAETGADPKGL